jgi:hypothetical protein
MVGIMKVMKKPNAKKIAYSDKHHLIMRKIEFLNLCFNLAVNSKYLHSIFTVRLCMLMENFGTTWLPQGTHVVNSWIIAQPP